MPGRPANERMNEAVSHRLAHPTLSLTDALLRGGFGFGDQPLPPPPGVLDRDVLDDDGVSLQQRKNQLMRRLRKARDRKKVDKANRNAIEAVRQAAAAPDETVATGVDGEYYDMINSKRRKTGAGEDTAATGTEGSPLRQQIYTVAAFNAGGAGGARNAPSINVGIGVDVGNVDAIPGGPTILDRLTALEQVQSALRMNAEMQRHILAEQQQQEARKKDIAEDSHRADNVEEGANDNHTSDERRGHRDNPTKGEATRQEVQELQHNLQRLVEDVLVTESDRHDDDMLKDYLLSDDSTEAAAAAGAAASLAATAAAAEHIRRTRSESSTPSVHGTLQSTTTGLQIHALGSTGTLPTLFGAGPGVGGIGTVSVSAGMRVPNVVGALNAAAIAAAVPPPLPTTGTLTGGQYLDQTMMQEQMAAFRRQQVAAFAELAAAAATGNRHQNA